MKKVTLKDSKGNEINDIMKDVLTFDCETTGLPPKGAKWDVNFAEFPNIVQLAWAVNEKERSYIIKPEDGKYRKRQQKFTELQQREQTPRASHLLIL